MIVGIATGLLVTRRQAASLQLSSRDERALRSCSLNQTDFAVDIDKC